MLFTDVLLQTLEASIHNLITKKHPVRIEVLEGISFGYLVVFSTHKIYDDVADDSPGTWKAYNSLITEDSTKTSIPIVQPLI